MGKPVSLLDACALAMRLLFLGNAGTVDTTGIEALISGDWHQQYPTFNCQRALRELIQLTLVQLLLHRSLSARRGRL